MVNFALSTFCRQLKILVNSAIFVVLLKLDYFLFTDPERAEAWLAGELRRTWNVWIYDWIPITGKMMLFHAGNLLWLFGLGDIDLVSIHESIQWWINMKTVIFIVFNGFHYIRTFVVLKEDTGYAVYVLSTQLVCLFYLYMLKWRTLRRLAYLEWRRAHVAPAA